LLPNIDTVQAGGSHHSPRTRSWSDKIKDFFEDIAG